MLLVKLQSVVHGIHHLLGGQFLRQIRVPHVFGDAITLIVGGNDDGVADEILSRVQFHRVFLLQQNAEKRQFLQVEIR